MYTETRDALAKEPSKQEVLVLRGGFAAFQAVYKVCCSLLPQVLTRLTVAGTQDDVELVEKWEKSVWGDAF